MNCKRSSESIFDRQIGGKHVYIYELHASGGQRSGNERETKTLEASNPKES